MGAGVTAAIVVVTRAAAARPALVAATVGCIAVGAVLLGLVLHGRHHDATWRRAWTALGLGLAAFAASVMVRSTLGPDAPELFSWLDALTLVGDACAAAGLLMLLRSRLPGRGIDALIEGVMCAVAVGFVPWFTALGDGVPAGETVVLVLPMAQVVVLWLLVRLLLLTKEQPAAYRYLVAAFACMLTVDAVFAGGLLNVSGITRTRLDWLELWACCLWAAAALHPSLRQSFEPVAGRPARLRPWTLVALFGLTLLAPVAFAIRSSQGAPPDLGVALVAMSVLPVLVAVYLVRQVQDRASAEHRAQHDPLTGLPNRALFDDRVELSLAQARRNGTQAAVMFLDLDRFKGINDSLGHAVGDQLLQAVGRRLGRTLRESDTVARMGGDEFALLLPGVEDDADCVGIAEKLLDAFRTPFAVGGRQLATTTSIGVALFPRDGEDAETLLKHADTAMYRAKSHGRAAFELFTADMSARARVRLSLESALRRAIDDGDLRLHYQPKVDLATRRVVGVEALVRWPQRELGVVSPGAFIPLAEETGLILPLGEWVLEAACRQSKEWTASGLPAIPIGVNVSARQFADQGFERVVRLVLDSTGQPPDMLELEITESVFMRDLAAMSSRMQRLRDLGVAFSIDDFGTGYSGLNYLAQMPIDSLKIDRSFIGKITGGPEEAPIVQAVIALAHSLRMTVIAEGVETDGQASFLRQHGCEQMQGYLFSPPLPADELEHLLMVEGVLSSSWEGRDGAVADGAPWRSAAAAVAIDPDVSRLLVAACENTDLAGIDEQLVAEVLDALQASEPIVPVPSPMRSASMRVAAGTFVGLMPVSSGLAAAGVLPAPAQQVAMQLFDSVGVHLPPLGPASLPEVPELVLAAPVFDAVIPARSQPARPSEPARTATPAVAAPVDPPVFEVAAFSVERPPTTPMTPPTTPPPGPQLPPTIVPPAPPVPPPPPSPSPPGQDHTPPGQDHTPPGQDHTPPGQDHTPPGHDHTPPGHDHTPPGHDHTPPGQDKTPPGQDKTPPGHDHTPPGHDHTPPGQDHTPPGHDHTPPGQDHTPPGHDHTPPGQDHTPPGQDHTPPGQDHTPPGHDHTPPGQAKP